MVVKGNSRFLLAGEDGWDVGRDCSSSTACTSEQRSIREALQGNAKTSVCTLSGHNQTLSFTQEHCDVDKEKRHTLN